MSAFWLSKGYSLYSEVQVRLYPAALEFLGGIFRIFEPSLHLARVACIASGALYLLTVGVTSRHLSAWVAGVASAGFVVLDQQLFEAAGLALSEVPTLAAAALSVMLALRYLETGRRAYLCGASLICGVSLLAKPLMPFLPLWLATVICAANWKIKTQMPSLNKRFVADSAMAIAFLGLPLALCLIIYIPSDFVETTLLTIVRLRDDYPWKPIANLNLVWDYLRGYWGVLLLALASAVLPARSDQNRLYRMALLWLLLAFNLLFLVLHSPLFDRHCTVLSLPLVLLAGVSISSCTDVSHLSKTPYRWIGGALVVLVTVVFVATTAPRMVAWCNSRTRYEQGGPEAAAIRLLEQVTSPSELVVSDDLALVFLSQRRVPPRLSDMSHARNYSGHLTGLQVIAEVEKYDIQAAILWTDRLDELWEFVWWAERHFVSVTDFGERRRILYGRRYDSVQNIAGFHPSSGLLLNESVRLIGYRLEPNELRTSNKVRLVLYWQCIAPLDKDYTVFVHLADAAGTPLSQGDGPPVRGLYPTSGWQAGEILADVHELPVDAKLPPGEYQLLVGLYTIEPSGIQSSPPVRLTTVDVGPIGQ